MPDQDHRQVLPELILEREHIQREVLRRVTGRGLVAVAAAALVHPEQSIRHHELLGQTGEAVSVAPHAVQHDYQRRIGRAAPVQHVQAHAVVAADAQVYWGWVRNHSRYSAMPPSTPYFGW